MLKSLKGVVSAGALCAVACSPGDPVEASNPQTDFAADIQQTCDEIPNVYAYFSEREPIWEAACAQALIDIEQADTSLDFLIVLERLLDDLYDAHISLNTNSSQSPRLVPSGSDVWIGDESTNHSVLGVRPESGAAPAGVKTGDQLVSFNGLNASELMARRSHALPDQMTASRKNWALNAAISGYRHEPRTLVVSREGVEISYDLGDPEPAGKPNPITTSTMGNYVGYIRFNNSLGNSETVLAFDNALEQLSETQGLVIDLRDTPGGGNTGVAEPILGRLVNTTLPYQITVAPSAESISRQIEPTGAWTYEQPIIALVGRWTGSMGEGMAIGLDGMARAEVLGDCMAALAGGTNDISLRRSGISIRVPAYDLTHLDGTPRHLWCVDTPVVADAGNQDDELLKSAIKKLGEAD